MQQNYYNYNNYSCRPQRPQLDTEDHKSAQRGKKKAAECSQKATVGGSYQNQEQIQQEDEKKQLFNKSQKIGHRTPGEVARSPNIISPLEVKLSKT